MFLITRCPNCHTRFRVTDQHLAAYGGKVRCGRCSFVFNGNEYLQAPTAVPQPELAVRPDAASAVIAARPVSEPAVASSPLDADTLPQAEAEAEAEMAGWPQLATDNAAEEAEAVASADIAEHKAVPAEPVATPAVAVEAAVDSTAVDDFELAIDEPAVAEPAVAEPVVAEPVVAEPVVAEPVVAEPPSPVAAEHPAVVAAPRVILADDTERFDFELAVDEPLPGEEPLAPAPAAVAGGARYRPILTDDDAALLALPKPRSPWRWLWLLPIVLALATLLGQLSYQYRTELAIALPGLKPHLQWLCAQTGCRLAPPRHAEFLRTEWSELSRVPDHEHLVQVNATLRNHAPYAQDLPYLELTLSDSQDRVVAKRVFTPVEYLTKQAGKPQLLAANADVRAYLQLDLTGLDSDGYSLYWFYP